MKPAINSPAWIEKIDRRKAFGGIAAILGGVTASQVIAAKANPITPTVSPELTFEQARKAYPVTVKEASAIMMEHYRNDGPLFADDVTGTTAFADWETARLARQAP